MWRRFLAELDAVVGTLLAVVVAALSLYGVASQAVVAAAVLLILALLLTLFLRLRPALAKLADNSNRSATALEALKARAKPTDIFRLDYPDLGPLLANAKVVRVAAGGSLRTTVGSYFHQFSGLASRGAQLHFLCPDPKKRSAMTSLGNISGRPMSDVKSGVESSLSLAARLKPLAPSSTSVEIRVAASPPASGSVHIQYGGVSQDVILVKLLPYGYSSGAAPVFVLHSLDDAELFKIVSASMDNMWNDSTSWP